MPTDKCASYPTSMKLLRNREILHFCLIVVGLLILLLIGSIMYATTGKKCTQITVSNSKTTHLSNFAYTKSLSILAWYSTIPPDFSIYLNTYTSRIIWSKIIFQLLTVLND